MQAQTSRNADISVGQEVTPVIVKIGGGDATPAAAPGRQTYSISIASDFMTFQDQSGASWQKASSNLPGRIHELTVEDGNLQPVYCNVLPQSNALTTVDITFETANGTEKLSLGEQKDGDNFRLAAQSSSVSFEVTTPAPHGHWKASAASFLGKPVKVTLKQTSSTGEHLVEFEYLFNHAEISLGIDFHYQQ